MIYIFALFLIVYLVTCLALVGFILTQEGKGGGLSGIMGASMGETFGFGGATSTIRKFTSIAALIFLVLSIGITFLGEMVINQRSRSFLGGDEAAAPAAVAPATTGPAGQAPTEVTIPAATVQEVPGATAVIPATSVAPAAADPAAQAPTVVTVPAATVQEVPAAASGAPSSAPAPEAAPVAPAAAPDAAPVAPATAPPQ